MHGAPSRIRRDNPATRQVPPTWKEHSCLFNSSQTSRAHSAYFDLCLIFRRLRFRRLMRFFFHCYTTTITHMIRPRPQASHHLKTLPTLTLTETAGYIQPTNPPETTKALPPEQWRPPHIWTMRNSTGTATAATCISRNKTPKKKKLLRRQTLQCRFIDMAETHAGRRREGDRAPGLTHLGPHDSRTRLEMQPQGSL